MGDPALDLALDAAVTLRRDLHRARARLVQRSPAGSPHDPRDAAEVRRLEALWQELSPSEQRAAAEAFLATHFCRRLIACPLGPRPWRGE